jgi:diacylglycerol kinase (ATP)
VSPRRILVIWNPSAGTKAGLPTNRSDGDDLRTALDGLGREVEVELYESPSAEATVERAHRAVEDGVDVVAAAGGDGTAYSIARCLLGTETALGLLPMGSAMNLVRALEIPRELPAAAAVLRDGVARRVDVGLVRDRPFFEIVSVGLSADAFEHAQAIDRRHDWGAVLDLLRLVIGYRRSRIELELDDETLRTRAVAVAIANLPYTGMGVTLAPDARIDDGRLDVVVFEGLSPIGLIGHMLRVAGGREPASRFRHLRTTRAVVRSRHPLPVRADAADADETPVEVRIRPGDLRVVVSDRPGGR